MEKCSCMKVTFSKLTGEEIVSAHLCCGKCDVRDIPEDAELRFCFSPEHKCRSMHLIRDKDFPDLVGIFDPSHSCIFTHLTGLSATPDCVDVIENEISKLEGAPEFVEYYLYKARLQTFDEWPKNRKQTPGQLSTAGFFYTKKDDRVICFCCGQGLYQWEEVDDPWEQHALYRESCEYLHLVKGSDYIASVKEKFAVDEPDLSALFIEN